MKTLEFSYKKIGEKYFPIIQIALRREEKEVKTLGYVDSGASYSLFDAELAEVLEIDYKKGERYFPLGIGGHICSYINPITLIIEGAEIHCDVLFSDELLVKFNLIGRVGLFDIFRICFDDVEKKLILIPKGETE